MLKIIKNIILSSSILALALPALAETSAKPAELQVSCIQAAVEKRDTSLIAAFDAYANAAKTALSARTSALKTAWAISAAKDRRAAIKQGWKKYSDSLTAARRTFSAAKKTAWQQFNAERKACGPAASKDDTTSSGADTNL